MSLFNRRLAIQAAAGSAFAACLLLCSCQSDNPLQAVMTEADAEVHHFSSEKTPPSSKIIRIAFKNICPPPERKTYKSEGVFSEGLFRNINEDPTANLDIEALEVFEERIKKVFAKHPELRLATLDAVRDDAPDSGRADYAALFRIENYGMTPYKVEKNYFTMEKAKPVSFYRAEASFKVKLISLPDGKEKFFSLVKGQSLQDSGMSSVSAASTDTLFRDACKAAANSLCREILSVHRPFRVLETRGGGRFAKVDIGSLLGARKGMRVEFDSRIVDEASPKGRLASGIVTDVEEAESWILIDTPEKAAVRRGCPADLTEAPPVPVKTDKEAGAFGMKF